MKNTVYPPREDTYLLKETVEELDLDSKKVLEIGCGNGVVTRALEKQGAQITAVDRNENALEATREKLESPEEHILKESDLFSNVEDEFDLIVFNPPYLPGNPDIGDEEKWFIGEENIVEKTLEEADDYLASDGELLMVISSHTPELEELKERFELEEIREEKLWFEKLYVVRYN